MVTEFPGTGVCVTCGGMAICLNCQPVRQKEADAIVRELAALRPYYDRRQWPALLERARQYLERNVP